MALDKDIVLKNFGYSSETNFMFYYVLQLFIAVEQGRTHDPYNIEADSVYTLAEQAARLPENIKRFILWQIHMMERSYEDLMNIEMPAGLTKKYGVKQQYLKQIEDEGERKQHIQDCINEIDEYFEKFAEVIAILETTEDRFLTIQDFLLRAESIYGEGISGFSDQKQKIDGLREEIVELKAGLEDDILPDIIKFSSTPEKAHQLIITLSQVNLDIRSTISQHEQK